MTLNKKNAILKSMIKVQSLLLLISLLGSISTFAEDAQFQLNQKQIEIQPGQSVQLEIQTQLPKGFHLYADQLKIQNTQPADFKFGQIKVSPETTFFDKHSQKNRLGFYEQGQIQFQVESPTEKSTAQEIQFGLRYQICSEQVCYLPKTENFKIELKPASTTTALPEEEKSFMDKFNLADNLYLSFLIVFIAGILTSFTPCIFPMIPITLSVLGHENQQHSRKENLFRSIMYVLGIATTYSSLGVLAALTGQLFGQALSNNYVLLFMIVLFAAMAFSMWGFFEIQVPNFIRQRLGASGNKGKSTYAGVFIIGLFAGIVASPCVGPVLVSILSFVSTTQNALLGFGLLFTYALGLGLIFIVIGLFSEFLKLLPKSGQWMNLIKFILGLFMLLTAIYYSQFLYKNIRGPRVHTQIEKPNHPTANWAVYSEENLKKAAAEGRPVMIDFFAEWCAACHELKEKTFSQSEFISMSEKFQLLVVDATEDTPEIQSILQRYEVKGLPTVIFINKNGQVIKDLSFTQFLEWPQVKPRMEKALAAE